jgi:hypothetical protein
MADISQVESAVAAVVTSTLYPSGSAEASIIGALCRVYRGWPNSATLNADLASGAVNVTINSDNDAGRTTTRYLPEYQTISLQPGLGANITDQTINFWGIPAPGDVVGALIDGSTYAYRIQAGDTPELVASNLNQLIQTDWLTIVRATELSVPGADSIRVRVVCDKKTSFESRRQEKDIRIACWCPTPLVRDAVASAVDMGVYQLSFLTLSDQTQSRITYKNTASYDQAQNALLYRRDLIYTVEYSSIMTFKQSSMLFGASDLNGNVRFG